MVSHPLPMPAPVLPRRKREPAGAAVTELPVPAEDHFVAAMLETPFSVNTHRNPLEWVASLVLHVLFIGALVVIPLCITDTIDVRAFTRTFLVGPPPPPPPAAPAPRVVRVAPKARFLQAGRLTSPVSIPKEIAIIKEAPLPPDTSGGGVVGGVPGGIPGGQYGGVLGGIIGGTGVTTAMPPPPPPRATRIVRVGGQVKPPRLIYQTELIYPPIARTARVEGTVTIDTIIDEKGDVVQARAVDGPGLLIPAALKTVVQWKYEPTLLNGQPVSIEMIVYVKYHLQ
ncbi:MAG TPA: energy transducer TonB [Candidatus Sulfotelmatobacter sp.]|nr:energy transducer TonB [Candidatus Sulfotelmatobacter sp.]